MFDKQCDDASTTTKSGQNNKLIFFEEPKAFHSSFSFGLYCELYDFVVYDIFLDRP